MAPVADPPRELGIEQTKYTSRQPEMRYVDINDRDDALSPRHTSTPALGREEIDDAADGSQQTNDTNVGMATVTHIPATPVPAIPFPAILDPAVAIPVALSFVNEIANLNTIFPSLALPTFPITSPTSTPPTKPIVVMTTSPITTPVATSRPSEDTPAALNPQVPQVVTMSTVTVVTTTNVIAMPIETPASFASNLFPTAPFPSAFFPTGTRAPVAATAAFDNAPSTPTVFISNAGENSDYYAHHGPPGGLSATAEDVLISLGSIGAFILMCFVCWMGWRMAKKRERARNGMDDDDFASPNGLLSKVQFFGRNQQPSVYESASASTAKGPTVSMYSTTSQNQMSQSTTRQGPMALPQLDTSVAFSPTAYARVNSFSASAASASPHGTVSTQHSDPYAERHELPAAMPEIQTTQSQSNVIINPFSSSDDRLVAPDVSPISAEQYGGGGTMETFQSVSTDRSRLPGYFNQSEFARAASAAYDPASRAVYRASALSSISSGFGDGDIIVPPLATLQQDSDSRPFSYAKSAGGLSRRGSVANQSEAGGFGQRDTMYTATSEDMPVRYRSVNSWVDQQFGRVKRQKQRDDAEDIPPVPLLPPEQRLTMMMDDGEVPRRYDDTNSSQPPVPVRQNPFADP